jgi:choline dehydrogenase-like flavoprotein
MTVEFDFIIIGAGSAGCVVANRLSADAGKRVCVIEAGGSDDGLRVKIPAGILSLYGNPNYDYSYVGVPQPELNNRSIPINRGKVLGGSSSINSMIYIRGAKEDYDEWASLGCDNWAYSDVLPVFKKLECNRLNQSSDYHGFNGELLVDKPQDPNIVSKMFVKAARHQQIPTNNDFNADTQFGAGIYNVTQDKGQRFSSYSAFLKPVKDRKNLTIMTKTQVIELIIDSAKKVTGVKVIQNGVVKTISCKAEVILCAGTIDSPRILLSSGIGPSIELAALGIESKVNLPGVGKNLRDHIDGMITVRSSSIKTLGLSVFNLPSMLAAPFKYAFQHKGMLSTNYVEAGGFARTKFSPSQADIQFHFVPGYRSHRGRLVEYGHGFAIHTCVLRPKSIGELTLSKDTSGYQLNIDNQFFTDSDNQDAKTLVEGIKVARSIFSDPEFDKVRGEEVLPGLAIQTDDEILDYLRAEALTVYHPVGTCKMGVDKMAVVDPSTLKVSGIQNLRIADASIMPTLIGGNTSAPSMMIGDRAATMITA